MSERDPVSTILRHPFVAGIVFAAVVLTLYVVFQFVRVLLTVFAGILLAVFLSGLTSQPQEHLSLPRPVALSMVLVALSGLLVGLWMLVGPDISEQVTALAALLPDAAERLGTRLRSAAGRYEWAGEYLSPSELIPPVSSVLGGVTNVFRGTLDLVVNAFIILFIGIYGAAAPQHYVDSVVLLVPSTRRARARDVIHAIARALRWWVAGRFVMMTIVGVLTALGLGIAGIPSPMALGLVAALFSFIPYLGPVLSVVPAVLVASTLSLTKVLYVLLVYGTVQILESYLITPLVQERAVHILPAAIITAQFIGGVVAGAAGVLLATPVAVVVIVLVQTLYVEDVLGDEVALLGEH